MEWGIATIAEAFVQYNMKREEREIAGGVEADDLPCSCNAERLLCLVYLVSLVLLIEFSVRSTKQTR
jgi:hypothetical protein